MNLSDIEQKMKAAFDETGFSPKEGEWARMQEALKPKRASILLLLPFHKAIAAAAVLVALGTSGLYLLFSGPGKTNTVALNTPAPAKQAMPQIARKPNPAAAAVLPYPAISGIHPIPKRNTPANVLPEAPDHTQPPALTTAVNQPEIHNPEQPLAPAPTENTKRSSTQPNYADKPYYYAHQAQTKSNMLRLGLGADVGKASLGNVQYNFSIVARKPIGERFFAEANVSLSSAQLNYSEKGTDPTSSSIPGDGMSAVKDQVDLKFANNIVSIGVAPAVGFKVASHLSVAAGADIYRALNRNLAYQNALTGDDFTKSYGRPAPQRNITNWDFGLKAQVEYKLNSNFSLSTQYRQGLTEYIIIDGKSLKNSNFMIGFKYYLIKVR